MNTTIRFVKRLPGAKMPVKATSQSAGFDLHAAEVQMDLPNRYLLIDTGLSISFDPGYVLFLYGRSGLASKYGIRLANGVGVIDADYRGPIRVVLRSDRLTIPGMTEIIRVGDRVAQGILVPIPSAQWVEVDELDETERGTGGFGSTGLR